MIKRTTKITISAANVFYHLIQLSNHKFKTLFNNTQNANQDSHSSLTNIYQIIDIDMYSPL